MNTLLPWRLLVFILAGWINRHQQDIIDYLLLENRILKRRLRGWRLRLPAVADRPQPAPALTSLAA
ncbi:MAG: hypothetical protein JXP34_06775 [Planctomycetes bacterium]|nr:hypothetical protein [Planctomycetota bacterium]